MSLSSAFGCQAGLQLRAGLQLVEVPLQSWDPTADTKQMIMLSGKQREQKARDTFITSMMSHAEKDEIGHLESRTISQ